MSDVPSPEPYAAPPAVFIYRLTILEQLASHGVVPTSSTPPALARGFVSELYRYELRKLRARLLQREFPKEHLSVLVVELRERYPVLSIPMELWISEGPR